MTRSPAVFFVSSHGMAGDHWFDWFPKALGSHAEILLYMGESVRSKYLHERSRKDRPDVFAFADFLRDLGAPYQAIGECFAYRSYQLEPLRERFGDEIRFINLLRHPYCWISFYVTWRVNNLNQPPGVTTAIDHEWNVTRHDEFATMGLPPYTRADVEVWTTYQAMHILNRMRSDTNPGVLNHRLEDVVAERSAFESIVDYLTHGKIRYAPAQLDQIYTWVDTPWRPGASVLHDPHAVRVAWPEWKVQAFSRIVTAETVARFESLGYTL